MLITTADDFPDHEIERTIGMVVANAVRARHVGRDIQAALKNLVGGEIGAYQQLLVESRSEAIEVLTADAESQGADAIVALRMATSSIAQGASEVLVYGTAVKLRS
ncbi:MAG: heavy metal-binding domain-containing protein [Chloroflexi bacterium]|nr:heavy metal-binding domain-containing protein [Chloroflexota bacterium]MDA1146333.1 heavy metal-binding domain-containing protein [Chloroflexota bacterium]